MNKYLKTKEGSIEDVVKQMQNKVMENDYQDKFKKELDKAGKPLGHMTGAEKKAFFNKIDKMHKGKNENAPSVADIDRLKKQGMKPVKEDLDSKDEPKVKDVAKQLKKAVQAHDQQAKDLEKAIKSEKVDNPYAVGMSQAMKSTGDTPPLKKSTITKAHDIAKSIKKDEMKEARWYVSGQLSYRGIGSYDGFEMVIDAPTESSAEQKAYKELDKARDRKKIGPGGGGSVEDAEIESIERTNDRLQAPSTFTVSEYDPSKEVKETHMSTTKAQNQRQKDAKGEKEIIKREDKEWKTFAQMRAEIDEACWDSHKQVGFKMKGGKRVPNCVPKNEEADKGKKEQEAGEDTRDKKEKTMTGQVATSPEMNPKVDYKY